VFFFQTDINHKRGGDQNTAVCAYTQGTYYLILRKIKESCLIMVLSSSFYVKPVVLPEETVT
jgi:hypothetical protein